jgi:hypothetical protein
MEQEDGRTKLERVVVVVSCGVVLGSWFGLSKGCSE